MDVEAAPLGMSVKPEARLEPVASRAASGRGASVGLFGAVAATLLAGAALPLLGERT